MKKVLLILMNFILCTILVTALTTGTITLTGVVAEAIDIAIVTDANASSLDLAVDTTNLIVATITEKSNVNAGYSVTLSSANSVVLQGSTTSLAYTLEYDNVAINFVGADATITDSVLITNSSGVSKNLTISYTGDAGLPADTYSDILTFTIIAK